MGQAPPVSLYPLPGALCHLGPAPPSHPPGVRGNLPAVPGQAHLGTVWRGGSQARMAGPPNLSHAPSPSRAACEAFWVLCFENVLKTLGSPHNVSKILLFLPQRREDFEWEHGPGKVVWPCGQRAGSPAPGPSKTLTGPPAPPGRPGCHPALADFLPGPVSSCNARICPCPHISYPQSGSQPDLGAGAGGRPQAGPRGGGSAEAGLRSGSLSP